MKILHLTPSVGPLSGGMGAGALELARHQRALGCNAAIWCVDPPEVVDTASAHGLQGCISSLPSRGPRALAYSPAAERRAGTEPADIVHQHGVWTAQGRVTRTFRRRGISTVVAPHGSLEPYARRRSTWKKRVALAAFESANLREASCLHATAESEVRTLRDFGLRAPIALMPNGVPLAWLESRGDASRFRQRIGLEQDERILLFLSRLHPIKGLPLALEALADNRARLGVWRLVIAGPDERAHRSELEALTARLGISRLVRFTGALHGAEKRDAFAAAELFVLPSHSENFGIVVAEALGAGVPVLTTHGTPWSELETYQCGWWVPVDSDAIGAALLHAATLPAGELREMGDRGRALIEARYVWSSVAERALAVYSWLARRGSKPDFVIVD
ncbi:glycosyltransferase [soil metagenome]|nr:glycosyltransferase [Acidobacteriota bacterium]